MTYKRIQLISLAGRTILIIGILINVVFAQADSRNDPKGNISEIYAETFAYKSDSSGKGHLDVYIQVPYSGINFVKEGEQYTGHIEMSATAVTQDKLEIWHISQIIELRLQDFAQVMSHRLSSIKKFSTDLSPGKYELILQVTDNESKKMAIINRSVTIKDFSAESLSMSDLMLVHRMDVNGIRKNIVPNLSGILSKEENEFYLFFEIYCKSQLDSVQLLCSFINQNKETAARRVKSEALTGDRTQITWRIDAPSLAVDQYVFFIEVTGYSKTDPAVRFYTSSSRLCFVRLKDLPLTITDIDKATDQLQYFAPGSDIAYIKQGATQEERQKRFFEFWAKHDSYPKTLRNELMEEYYSRVAFANMNFTHSMEGWKTDRGMVYIRFGPPQNIDRRPFNIDSKPYEIWYYYDHNRKFIFVDETGFGDYRIQYFGSDLWGRIQ